MSIGKMIMAKKLYAILGLDDNASQEQIKKAYRTLSLKNHPDIGGSEEVFKSVTNAYSVLHDPVLRHLYDRNVIDDNGKAPRELLAPDSVASMDHYQYLNFMLHLEDENRLQPGKPIQNQPHVLSFLEGLKGKYEADLNSRTLSSTNEFITQSNLMKLNDTIEILRDENARARYDQGLLQRQRSAQPAAQTSPPLKTPLRTHTSQDVRVNIVH